MNSVAFPAFFWECSIVALFLLLCHIYYVCAACTQSVWHILKGHTMQRDAAQEKAMCALLT